MKTTLLIFMIAVTTTVTATMEHREGFEAKPLSQKLTNSRGCFAEIQEHGCTHPREGQEVFNTCLEEKINNLKPSCQAFFEKLYGRKTKEEPDFRGSL